PLAREGERDQSRSEHAQHPGFRNRRASARRGGARRQRALAARRSYAPDTLDRLITHEEVAEIELRNGFEEIQRKRTRTRLALGQSAVRTAGTTAGFSVLEADVDLSDPIRVVRVQRRIAERASARGGGDVRIG